MYCASSKDSDGKRTLSFCMPQCFNGTLKSAALCAGRKNYGMYLWSRHWPMLQVSLWTCFEGKYIDLLGLLVVGLRHMEPPCSPKWILLVLEGGLVTWNAFVKCVSCRKTNLGFDLFPLYSGMFIPLILCKIWLRFFPNVENSMVQDMYIKSMKHRYSWCPIAVSCISLHSQYINTNDPLWNIC